ncbi:MAG: UDP-N-acetylglucosamine--N-acetylmuramyl-(pentapeptide) pyrophosphoryl-undecaprenol N-acetylglucosamine transferase [Polyangiaceae bacterium]|nr:UDP-N-acetylglucosamine--N-acetylmuramyl-(pentapeptide) pyrophosphoryl-undecaprenol N-acetylglucosamine transferase [Polyangiaceae bacterium]
MTVSLLFAGGGTGGHVFPLLAVAQAVRGLRDDVAITFVGTARGMESRILGQLGERLELMDILPIKGGGAKGAAKGVIRAAGSIPDAARLVRRISPQAVLSIGGYAAGPVALAAKLAGIPLALLEPNSVLGLANLIVAPIVDRAYLAFPNRSWWGRKSAERLLGVPLRTGFSPREYQPSPDEFRVLVLGGSQGAVTLNRNVPEAIGILRTRTSIPVRVVHQSGRDRVQEVRNAYEARGSAENVDVVDFIDDVPESIAWADLVIQRAGAGAVAEVSAIGRASLFVPYPFAAGNHQVENARAMEKAGAAVCVSSHDATGDVLAVQLERFASDIDLRQRMAGAARRRGRPGAAVDISRDLLELAEVD